MLNSCVCALDIGSSKIAAVVAQIKRRRITNIFFESLTLKSVKRGVIIDSVDLIGAISKILKNLKIKSGTNIKSIYTNISGQNIITKHSHAVIPLAERGNKVITAADIHRVNEQARILGLSLEEEIIHQIPFGYTIDSMANVLNPLGLYSHRLEVDLYLICGKLSFLQTLTRVINQAGYEIKDLFSSGIATSKIVFDEKLKEGINVLCDIGFDTTELLIFRAGMLRHIEILSLGGNDFTEELAQTLKIPFDLAEDVKRSYGMIGEHNQAKQDKEVLVKKDNIYKSIKQELISQILTSKTKLICQTLKDTIENIVPGDEIQNFVTVGRTVLLEGFLERLENALGISVKIGRAVHPDTKVSTSQRASSKTRCICDIIFLVNRNPALCGQNYLTYLTSLGIICQALYSEEPQFLSAPRNIRNPILRIISKFKDIYQEYF